MQRLAATGRCWWWSVLALAVLAGAVMLWPRGEANRPAVAGQEDPTRLVSATLTQSSRCRARRPTRACPAPPASRTQPSAGGPGRGDGHHAGLAVPQPWNQPQDDRGGRRHRPRPGPDRGPYGRVRGGDLPHRLGQRGCPQRKLPSRRHLATRAAASRHHPRRPASASWSPAPSQSAATTSPPPSTPCSWPTPERHCPCWCSSRRAATRLVPWPPPSGARPDGSPMRCVAGEVRNGISWCSRRYCTCMRRGCRIPPLG
jgi:hypothetical protein